MTYPEINTLTSPLSCLPINKPIISYSTYIRNKLKDLDCNYWRVHTSDRYIEFDSQHFYGISNYHKRNNVLSSTTLNKIKSITNKYLADKRIYISEITPQSYYYLSRGYKFFSIVNSITANRAVVGCILRNIIRTRWWTITHVTTCTYH